MGVFGYSFISFLNKDSSKISSPPHNFLRGIKERGRIFLTSASTKIRGYNLPIKPEGCSEALEMRRLIAARLLQQGRGIREVARMVGDTPASVLRWGKALERGDIEALKATPHHSKPQKLTDEQKDNWKIFFLGVHWLQDFLLIYGH